MLAERGTKVLLNVSSSTRDHITCVLTVIAGGDIMPPMCLFRGVRNVAAVHLATLPQDGKSGAWSLHSTEKGFITSEKFVVLLQELVKHLEERQIERPVILFMDGASPLSASPWQSIVKPTAYSPGYSSPTQHTSHSPWT